MDTLLIEACKTPFNLVTVKWLTEHMDADPKFVDEEGRTALMAAVQAANKDIIEYLTKYDIDFNVQEKEYGQTVLHMLAEQAYDEEIIELFLDRGADPTIKDKSGKNAMDYAIETHKMIGDYEEVVALLKENGAKE